MSDVPKSVYFADTGADPVAIRVDGRASFQNSPCLQDFVDALIASGRSRFQIDFNACTGMDSTFLGVLAGTALRLRKLTPPGQLTLTRISARNLELVRNLGLHRILTVAAGDPPADSGSDSQSIPCAGRSELESAKVALQAHENLVAADEDNRARFEDVLHFLRKRIEEENL